mmetsp:Transcript_14316/g.21193  ORF Transcript_14316/g.21193 Transcript_14316/m.21193 type:complete len:414 (-) Transcript_14316:100-1341(-)|eukprot:CAMPEP_0116007032 /NCGR_PEP_ID=MMETSP0321-20121206/2065_1 /TAXON_ID=163516 /ORGANISM="Leptocylindrus danicus var. danicus, Strain B650" /LENGTH=413 /DNA_ID=CAMNT_0003475665 /DNA_START=306 /DNA_END=1547 /DNA_ORIENTATION=+
MTNSIAEENKFALPSSEQRIHVWCPTSTTQQHTCNDPVATVSLCGPNNKEFKTMETASLSSTSFSSSTSSSSSTFGSDFLEVTKPLRVDIRQTYAYMKSTEENWRSDDEEFYGPYADIRASLDYTYHSNYKKDRQALQDNIVKQFLSSVIRDRDGFVCTTPTEPWIVFTAGAMGAGKSHTIHKLKEMNHFPLLAFVKVDPDEIRREIPEFSGYLKENPLMAGDLTKKEAGYIAEILTLAALKKNKNVLVDGSLRDTQWYKEYFVLLRRDYPKLRISILHIVAPREAVFARAKARGDVTGRIVPRETIEESLEQVPKSVNILGPLTDYFAELDNSPQKENIELITPKAETWDHFSNNWLQTCAFRPKQKLILFSKLDVITRQMIDRSSLTKERIRKLSMELDGSDSDTESCTGN